MRYHSACHRACVSVSKLFQVKLALNMCIFKKWSCLLNLLRAFICSISKWNLAGSLLWSDHTCAYDVASFINVYCQIIVRLELSVMSSKHLLNTLGFLQHSELRLTFHFCESFLDLVIEQFLLVNVLVITMLQSVFWRGHVSFLCFVNLLSPCDQFIRPRKRNLQQQPKLFGH